LRHRTSGGDAPAPRRWDGQDLRAFTGTYGDYLLGKVSRVFPELFADVDGPDADGAGGGGLGSGR